MKKGGTVVGLLVISMLLIGFVSAQNETNGTVEPECSYLAISMWCPDETNLCTMKTD